MKRGLRGVTGVGITAAALAVCAPAAGAASVPDASCTVGPGVTIVQDNGNQKVAQTFTALHTGQLDTATMTVVAPGGATPLGNWLFELVSAPAGSPGPVLASVSVPNTLPADVPGAVTGTFPSSAHVTAGTTYALLLSRPGSGYQAADAGGDPCPGSQAFYQNAVGGPFIVYPFVDFGFSTTVRLPDASTRSAKCKKKKHKKHVTASKKHKKCKKRKKGKR